MENEYNINNNNDNNKQIDISEELKKSIETLILYRSLYILKKKYETKKDIIRKIYNSFNLDINENVDKYYSYQVSIDNFEIIAKTVFEKCNILLIILNNPKDILLSNLFLNINNKIEEMISIFKDIKKYISDEKNSLVKKYNNLFYEKKIKVKMIKNIIELKQQNKIEKKEKQIEIKKEKEKEDNVIIKEEKEEIKEEIEIQRKIVEYNRKGKIIKTYNITTNDNLTLIINEEKNKNEKIKNKRIIKKEKYFKLNENNDNKRYEIKEEKNKKKEIIPKNIINLIDIENDKNYNNIMYIETLPLIIADFIQQFPFYTIIEIEDELNEELNILFDKELVEKINNYEEALKNKNDKIINEEYQNYINKKNKLENNIKIYENLINEKKSKNENTSYLEDMLEKLLMNNVIVKINY